MVLLINGVPLEEAPRDVSAFISQYPHFKESASRLCSMKPETIGPHGLIYVFSREFAVTHPHDNKISVMGTDDITTSHIIVIKHSGIHNCFGWVARSTDGSNILILPECLMTIM